MPSLFQKHFEERVQPAQERAFGILVRLERGVKKTASFTATFDEPEPTVASTKSGGVEANAIRRNFRFPKTSVVINGETVIPEERDLIVEVESGRSFKILKDGDLRAVESLPGDYRWLVRTKE